MILQLDNLPPSIGPSVVSIGNFDGVHRGHQTVIQQLSVQAQRLALPTVVVTFEPLAKEYFANQSGRPSPARITSIEQRTALLQHYGVDQVCCLAFDERLVACSADDFIRTLLVDYLQARYLVVGDDFRFGHQRSGDFELLSAAGQRHAFSVSAMETFKVAGERVSSGRVRAALQIPDFSLTTELLGRPFSIAGNVARGQQLGRTIGFPTANIELPDVALPLQGVFAVTVDIRGHADGAQNALRAIANIGTRPTVDGQSNRLEVHILDIARQWQGAAASYDFYGCAIDVTFVRKIRDEIKFAGVDDLQRQIQHDVRTANDIFDRCV